MFIEKIIQSSFKIYKPADPKYILGLNKNGYCITLDIPFEKNKKFQKTTRLINEITIKYNGQVYLGKTPCLNNEEFKEMYKNHRKFPLASWPTWATTTCCGPYGTLHYFYIKIIQKYRFL